MVEKLQRPKPSHWISGVDTGSSIPKKGKACQARKLNSTGQKSSVFCQSRSSEHAQNFTTDYSKMATFWRVEFLQWWHLPTRFNPTQLVSWVGRCDNAFRLFRRIGPVLAYVIEVPAINFAKIHKLILIDILLTKIDYTQTDTTEYIIIRRLTVSGR